MPQTCGATYIYILCSMYVYICICKHIELYDTMHTHINILVYIYMIIIIIICIYTRLAQLATLFRMAPSTSIRLASWKSHLLQNVFCLRVNEAGLDQVLILMPCEKWVCARTNQYSPWAMGIKKRCLEHVTYSIYQTHNEGMEWCISMYLSIWSQMIIGCLFTNIMFIPASTGLALVFPKTMPFSFAEWLQNYNQRPASDPKEQFVPNQTCTKPTRVFCKHMYMCVSSMGLVPVYWTTWGKKRSYLEPNNDMTTYVFFSNIGWQKGPQVWSCLVFSASIFAVNNWIITATCILKRPF